MTKFEMNVEGHAFLEKTVSSNQNTGRVYVPKEWIGKKVLIVLKEPLDDD